MNKRPLSQTVRDHLDARELNPRQLDQLLRLQAAAQRHPPRRALRCWRAAAVVFLAAVAALSVFLYADPGDQVANTRQIAEEIALNHLKNRPLEVEGAHVSALRNYFTELDFVLSDSSRVAAGMRLMGGRYCSIQGAGAAQLRLRTANEGFKTWYQAPYDDEKYAALPNIDDDQVPLVRYARGVRVEMWIEKGLFFALAGD